MKKILLLVSAVAACILLIAATQHRKHTHAKPAVTIITSSLEISSYNGVTIKYIVRGYEAKNMNGVSHGSCLNTTTGPEFNKDGSIASKGVAGTIDPKGRVAQAGTFYCAAYTRNLQTGVKYYVRPFLKLSDGTIIYGGEKSITMN